ncbi:MAG: hypothetical protein A2Y62_04440 [Candidatus Fischerbacteria bacterium RBG_13_37_8]|uniref:Uncharacterized protein n=1 Tax=Candidatus Fischerbacteria bacterium RBG_13_37_8 TaxID=1817863 RepID=A0A1F5V4U7_9BACT|nr:MAG: hypothetical protein A2Y62_04440 [Candidatus Fischerbacteria bacterium RBG_13_37_8]
MEDFNELSLEDREYVIEIINKQLIEAKRDAIAKRVKEARANYKKGKSKTGSAEHLLKDLESD